MKQKIYNEICNVITLENGRPIPPGILVQKIKDKLSINKRNVIYDVIEEMINNKVLRKLDSGKIVEGYINTELENDKYEGVISINSKLDGYVKISLNDETTDVYVNNINLNDSLSNDLVEIQLFKNKLTKSGLRHAKVTKVIEHNTKFVVGTFQLIGSTYNVDLDDSRNYLKVKLQDTEDLVNGYKLLIKIGKIENGIAYGDVSKILGHKDDVGVDILSIISSYNINPDFSELSLEQAKNCKINLNDNDSIRRNILDRNIVTIDPPTSKDLDDAIYVEKKGDIFFLSVSIADVAHYVKFDTDLWNEALNRSTSVYLTDRVVPMLPHNLSNNICSLNPDVERLCLTCDMEIDSNGNYSNIDVYPSIIKSKKRFSYDEVNDFFNNKLSFDDNLNKLLNDCKQLHEVLRKKKYEQGYIDFEIKEPIIVTDDNGWPIEIKIKERGIAQKMIEDFMICANEGVTIKAKENSMPFIYRIHNKPKIERLEAFSIEAMKLGVMIPKKDFEDISPSIISKWLQQNKNNENISLVSKLLLRCMQKAEYSIDNIGHFGLGISNYTHFTSPIRRSMDTVVHMLFWMYLFDPTNYSDQQREKLKNSLKELTANATEKEIIAVSAERDVNQLKFCQYLSKRIGEVFSGTISTIKSFGLFVELDNTIEVLVKIGNISNDFWKYDDNSKTIVGTRTNKVFTFGQKIDVRIIDVNIKARQINASIIGFEHTLNKRS